MPTIARINANLAKMADGKTVRFLDVNARLADPSGTLFEGMTVDGLHPSLKGYEVWAEGLKPILTELLGPPGRHRPRAPAHRRPERGRTHQPLTPAGRHPDEGRSHGSNRTRPGRGGPDRVGRARDTSRPGAGPRRGGGAPAATGTGREGPQHRLHPRRRPPLRRDGLHGPPDASRRRTWTRMARDGAHLRNAFVTTALCSPSAGPPSSPALYAHTHRRRRQLLADAARHRRIFPQYLQQSGYQTAFIGKWHMGNDDDAPQPGFDRWVSFRGQGTYLPRAGRPERRRQARAAEGLHHRRAHRLRASTGSRPGQRATSLLPVPVAQGRSRGLRAGRTPQGLADRACRAAAATMASGRGRRPGARRWVRNQRNSWHGVGLSLPLAARRRRVLPALRRDAARRRRQRRPRSRVRCGRSACSIRRSSSTWATTASRSASTA